MPNNAFKFYYRSYCDKDVTGYTLSGDFNSAANATDRNRLTSAITSGDDTDGDSVDFIVDMNYDRDVDTIILKSNLKTFTIYYWDGAAYQTLQAYAANTDEFIALAVTEQSTSRIKITATHTITANEEKKIYQLEITKKITEMNAEETKISKSWQGAGFPNLYGGSVRITKYPNHGKVTIKLAWEHLAGADFTAYDTLKNQLLIDVYSIYAYFSDTYNLLNVEAYYLVNDLRKYKADPTTEAMPGGVSGEMDLREG